MKFVTKIVLGIEYNGARFHGWQRQPGAMTIQESLENALSQIANQPITAICAGRTDQGVHALNQVVHFETTAERQPNAWVIGVNTLLPPDIKVHWVRQIDLDFSARFSAIARRYQYFIWNQRVAPAIYHGLASWVPQQLNENLMHLSSQSLIGEHDFSSFRSSGCQSKSSHRSIHHLEVSRKESWIKIDIKANAFLHHMVRNIVGVLLAVGLEKAKPSWAYEVLQARDRRAADITAPASGLYLTEVEYPPQWNLPMQPATTWMPFG